MGGVALLLGMDAALPTECPVLDWSSEPVYTKREGQCMSVTRDNLHCLLDRIPESELSIAERFLQFLSNEPIGPRFAESIRKGIAEVDNGDGVICRDLDEMTEKILGHDSNG
jgi:hypothetical protein